MSYVFNENDALNYEKWYECPRNRTVVSRENQLIIDMLEPHRGESILDIGCGTGLSFSNFLEKGLKVTGIDPSKEMLGIAEKKIGNRVDFYHGIAEDLPFDDNSFNYAALITTLEFVTNPEKAIEEACRVAKDKIFIGVLNRYALKGIKRRFKGLFFESIYNKARFFSIWELKQIIHSLLGDVPISWRTVCHIPTENKLANRIGDSDILKKNPFGSFVGISVTLVPYFRTTPIPITYDQRHSINVFVES